MSFRTVGSHHRRKGTARSRVEPIECIVTAKTRDSAGTMASQTSSLELVAKFKFGIPRVEFSEGDLHEKY